MDRDVEHLRLLSIFHYVVSGLVALFACFPCIHVMFGIAIVSGALDAGPGHEPPPAILGWFVIVVASAVILLGWSFAIAVFLVGRFLAQRAHYTYCLVVAGLECLFMPFGTVLAVFTIAVLIQPSVKLLFQGERPHAEVSTGTTYNASRVLGTMLFAAVGCLLGGLCFAQLGSCLGYYLGEIIHGFERQPPVGYVVAGGAFFALPGSVCGALASGRLRCGVRPNIVFAVVIALANVTALLGTIDVAFDFSFESLTMRTALVGIVSGLIIGLIVTVLLQPRPSEATGG